MHANPLRLPLYLQTLIGMALGVIVGMAFGEKAAFLGQFSKYTVEAIKTVAMPLLFFAIFDAVAMSGIKGKGVFAMVAICIVNGVCAITIALCISNIFKPGLYMPLESKLPAEFMSGLSKAIAENDLTSLFSGTTLAIAVSLSLGLIVRVIQPPFIGKLDSGTKKILTFLFLVIGYIALLIPFAVFAAVAKVVGIHGFSLVKGLTAYFIACLFGMLLHIAIVYQSWVRFIAKIPLKKFWKEARDPVIYSFGVNSSLATLPMSLQALKRLRVSDSAARLGACVGTNLNNDGILLYEVVASLFMAQAYGLHLDVFHQIILTVVCVFATIGVAGVPEAGMISLSLVMTALGLPLEGLPVLLTVDWVLGRMRSITNVLGDLTVSIGIDHYSGSHQNA